MLKHLIIVLISFFLANCYDREFVNKQLCNNGSWIEQQQNYCKKID